MQIIFCVRQIYVMLLQGVQSYLIPAFLIPLKKFKGGKKGDLFFLL